MFGSRRRDQTPETVDAMVRRLLRKQAMVEPVVVVEPLPRLRYTKEGQKAERKERDKKRHADKRADKRKNIDEMTKKYENNKKVLIVIEKVLNKDDEGRKYGEKVLAEMAAIAQKESATMRAREEADDEGESGGRSHVPQAEKMEVLV